MRRLKQFVAVLMCVSCTSYAVQATAQSSAQIELEWHALESCPSAASVLARVNQIAGSTRAPANKLRADATITQASDRLFRMRLEIRSGELSAVREIEGKSCKDLAGAAAVALALLLSSEEPLSERDLAGTTPTTASSSGGDSDRPKEPTAPHPVPSSARPAEPKASTPPSAEAESKRRWHVLVVAPLAALSVGPLHQLSRGLGGAVGFSFDRWRFLADGKIWASQHETVVNLGEEYDLLLERFTVSARGCRSIWGTRFEFAPCLLASVHHLSVHGSGPHLMPGTDTATWAAVGLGAQVRLLITSWLGLVAGVDGELQLSRPEVTMRLPVAGSPETTEIPVQRLGPAAATITVGSQWIF